MSSVFKFCRFSTSDRPFYIRLFGLAYEMLVYLLHMDSHNLSMHGQLLCGARGLKYGQSLYLCPNFLCVRFCRCQASR